MGGIISALLEGTTTAATAYGSETGSALTDGQTTTDSNGRFVFWIDEADYPLTIPTLDNDATPSVSGGAKRQRFRVLGSSPPSGPTYAALDWDNLIILPEHAKRKFLTGGTTTITDFDDGFEGLEIVVIAEHSLKITEGANIVLSGSADFDMTATDTLSLIQKADGAWYEMGRGDNGA